MVRRKSKSKPPTMNTNDKDKVSKATPTSSPSDSEGHLNAIEKFIEILRKCPEEISAIQEIMSNIETSTNKKECCETLKQLSEGVKNMNINQIQHTKNKINDIIVPESFLKIWIFQRDFEKSHHLLDLGATSTVFLGKIKNQTPSKKVAIKISIPGNEKLTMKEAETMLKLKHPNILEIIGFTTDMYIGIFTDYMAHGSLEEVLRETWSLNQLLKYVLDIANGLEYLVEEKFIHRKLCAANVLVNSNYTCKIGGFNLCNYIGNSEFYIDEIAVLTYYSAPEVKFHNTYSFASDIYSMGVLMIDILHSPEPFSDQFFVRLIGSTGFINKNIPLPSKCPGRLKNIIRGCLEEVPSKRPNIKQVKECVLKCLD